MTSPHWIGPLFLFLPSQITLFLLFNPNMIFSNWIDTFLDIALGHNLCMIPLETLWICYISFSIRSMLSNLCHIIINFDVMFTCWSLTGWFLILILCLASGVGATVNCGPDFHSGTAGHLVLQQWLISHGLMSLSGPLCLEGGYETWEGVRFVV